MGPELSPASVLGSAVLFVRSVLCIHSMVLSVNTYDNIVGHLRRCLSSLVMSTKIVISRHVLECLPGLVELHFG